MPTNNSINTGWLGTLSDVELGTDTTKLLAPSTFTGYMGLLDFTGFVSWAAGGPYYNVATLGTFKLLVGGTGYIKGKLITWVAQNYVGMVAGNCYYIYIDSSGTIGASTTRTDALFTDNIVLYECLRDSTPVTNVQISVKENHPYNYPATTSNYEHDNIGTLIENNSQGANITLNGTQKIQINGADVLSDHGLETTIPDSASTGVTFNKVYTLAGGKWATYTSTDTFTGHWNNAGTVTALSANKYAVYTLYVSKDNLNTTTPVYFAVLDTSQYSNLTSANNAIAAGSTSKSTNELQQLELCQLGYIIYSQASNSINSVIIAKTTLRSSTSTAGANQASLINVNTSTFTGWLGASDTTVQQSLNDLDQVLIGGTSGYPVVSNGGTSKPTYQQLSLTAGVTGVLPIVNGGTNASAMTTTDGVVYYDGTRLVTTTAGTATQVLTSNGAGVAPTFQSPASSPILTKKITLTSAQIKLLFGTPITIVSAQGANTIIVPISATSKFLYGGSNVFTGGAGIYVNYSGTMSTSLSANLFSATIMTGSVSKFSTSPAAVVSAQSVGYMDNVDLVVQTGGPNFGGNAANDNSIIIYLTYYVATLT